MTYDIESLPAHVQWLDKLSYDASYKMLLALDAKRGAHNNNLSAVEQDQFAYLTCWYTFSHNGS